MLGVHDGVSPFVDRALVKEAAVRALGRLKKGGDFAARRRLLNDAVAAIGADDPYWLDVLATKLTDCGLDAISAHLASLAAGWEVSQDDIAGVIRSVNTGVPDKDAARAIRGVRTAAPELARRMDQGRINSDEVFLRVAFMHLFRRDPESQIQMFVLDGVARGLSQALKMDVQAFTSSCLERFEKVPVPESAWGYIVVLHRVHARSGYFLPDVPAERASRIENVIEMVRDKTGADEDEIVSHVAAAAYSGFLMRGDPVTFGMMMAVVMQRARMRFAVLSVDDDDEKGDVYTRIFSFSARDVADARRKALSLPEVLQHDDVRRLGEMVAQISDAEEAPGRG